MANTPAKGNPGGSSRAAAHSTGALLPNTNINLGSLSVSCFTTKLVLFRVIFNLGKRVMMKKDTVSWNKASF